METESVIEESYDRVQLQKELMDLQKQIREGEIQFTAYKEESKRTTSKDTKEISMLEKQNEDVKINLENVGSKTNVRRDAETVEKLQATMGEGEQVQAEIDQEKNRQQQIHLEIKQMEKKIKQQRKVTVPSRPREPRGAGYIKRMEGRLDKANKDFAEKLKVNRNLREELETLRKDQAIFNKMHRKLNDEYKRTKKERDDLIDDTRLTYKQREDASNKRKNLEERNKEDQTQHDVDILNERRIISHVDNFRHFMNQKGEHIEIRRIKAEEERWERAHLKKVQADRERLEEYEKAFERVTEITGETDVQVIVDTFLKNDATFYSQFTFVANLESQVGVLENKVKELNEKNNKMKELAEQEDVEQAIKVNGMEDKHKEMMVLNDELEMQAEASAERVSTTLARVEDLYRRVSNEKDPLLELFDEGSGHVTERNYQLYLRELETKVTKLLALAKYKAKQEGTEPNDERDDLLPPKTPLGFVEYKSGFQFEDDEEDSFPLTLDEIRQQILQMDPASGLSATSRSRSAVSTFSEISRHGDSEAAAPLYDF